MASPWNSSVYKSCSWILSQCCKNRVTSLPHPFYNRCLMFETRLRSAQIHVSRKSKPRFGFATALGLGLAVGGGYGLYETFATPVKNRSVAPVVIDSSPESHENSSFTLPSDLKISRKVDGPTNSLGVELILFQYQSCPFCCKVRSFLEYYGLPYSIVEVNPVLRSEIKFSHYRKVPILMLKDPSGQYHQLNDSSAIVSMLATYLLDTSKSVSKHILPKYRVVTYTDEETKKQVTDVTNKYFLIYGDKELKAEEYERLNEERQWRQWVDDHLVHIISPNIYRTMEESKETFEQFSINGHWEDIFSNSQRKFIIYVGSTAMYFIGKRLKKKYSLKEDVRESLYDALRVWMKALKGRPFLGGTMPNLADIAVYGSLHSFEGCRAFKDMDRVKGFHKWYNNVKHHIKEHSASALIEGSKLKN